VRIFFLFDGVGCGKIWINSILAGVRTDFVSSIGSVGAAGVVIGNWTLFNQYGLEGQVDGISVWKHDPDAVVRQFVSRLDSDSRKGWDRFIYCIGRLDTDRVRLLVEFFERLSDLQRNAVVAMHGAAEAQREELFELLRSYCRAWSRNAINASEHIKLLIEIVERLDDLTGRNLLTQLARLIDAMTLAFGDRLAECYDCSGIGKSDPRFVEFIRLAAGSSLGRWITGEQR
jgi:hypothetical protein